MYITYAIVGITVILSLLAFNNKELKYKMMFKPFAVHHHKNHASLFTHAFIHADYMHLFFNMYVLFYFGRSVETIFKAELGPRGLFFFVLMYIGGVLFSSLPALIKHKDNPNYLSLGASGAVSAVLFSAIILMPQMKLMFFFIPVPITAWIFGIIYLGAEYFLDKRGGDNVAHDAHFWGALFGVLFTMVINPDFAVSFFKQLGLG